MSFAVTFCIKKNKSGPVLSRQSNIYFIFSWKLLIWLKTVYHSSWEMTEQTLPLLPQEMHLCLKRWHICFMRLTLCDICSPTHSFLTNTLSKHAIFGALWTPTLLKTQKSNDFQHLIGTVIRCRHGYSTSHQLIAEQQTKDKQPFPPAPTDNFDSPVCLAHVFGLWELDWPHSEGLRGWTSRLHWPPHVKPIEQMTTTTSSSTSSKKEYWKKQWQHQ